MLLTFITVCFLLSLGGVDSFFGGFRGIVHSLHSCRYQEYTVNNAQSFVRFQSSSLHAQYQGASDFVPPTEEEEEKMELEMAKMQFEELCIGDNSTDDDLLSVVAFMQWEDIVDVLSRGTLDVPIIREILVEVGVDMDDISARMDFPQFLEAVELVNQMTLALDGGSIYEDEDGIKDDSAGGEDGAGDTPDDLEWIMKAATARLG
mmetsp:Transcript_24428/g.40682  ORF Transcript_24428/g.40682 Transcript_24428/m.40682 type:complete len:205 (-) Transcript_24428:2116-2730(-)